MKLTRTLIISLVLTSLLPACGLTSPFNISKRDASQNQLCNRLKRDIVFYSMDQNHDTAWSSPAKQADILRQYKENDCEAILSGTATANPSESTPYALPGGKNANQNHIHVRQES